MTEGDKLRIIAPSITVEEIIGDWVYDHTDDAVCKAFDERKPEDVVVYEAVATVASRVEIARTAERDGVFVRVEVGGSRYVFLVDAIEDGGKELGIFLVGASKEDRAP